MLEVIGVTKSFHDKTAVDHVDLNVGDGEFLSILGPSGCGKTTLLRLIGGLEKPDRGSLRLAGQDITQVDAHKRNIHTVFQRYALFPHMSVFDNVAFGLRCKKIDEAEIRKRVEESLELANLKGQGNRAIPTLSGGEQQRVALIRALINMPKLLLLDEPLGALDLKLRLQLQQELVTIQKRVKTTFVFVTHDQQEALNMSDRVAVMNKAKIEQIGTPNEIYEFPKTYFVASFVGQVNCFEQTGGGRLCIRPEKISIYQRRPTTAENVAEGNIKAQSYLGTHTQFDIVLTNGQPVSVFQQNTQALAKRAFQIGDRVYIGWQTQHAQVFQGQP